MSQPRFSTQPPKPRSIAEFAAGADAPREPLFAETERLAVAPEPSAPPPAPLPSVEEPSATAAPPTLAPAEAQPRAPWQAFKPKGPPRHKFQLRFNDYRWAVLNEVVADAQTDDGSERSMHAVLMQDIILPALEQKAGIKRR